MLNVTALITAHNKENTIKECLESVIGQTHPNKNIVVIDDASKDKTWEILKPFVAQKDIYQNDKISGLTKNNIPIILYKTPKCIGCGEAKNVGVSIASKMSNAVLFVDGDDLIYKEKMWLCADEMEKSYRRVGIVYTDQHIMNEIDGFSIRQFNPPYARKTIEIANYIEPNCLVNMEALKVCGKFSNYLKMPDYEMWLKVTERFLAIHLPSCLSLHRITKTGLTNTITEKERAIEAKHSRMKH